MEITAQLEMMKQIEKDFVPPEEKLIKLRSIFNPLLSYSERKLIESIDKKLTFRQRQRICEIYEIHSRSK